MRSKLMIVFFLSMTIFLQAWDFETFEEFQQHINREAKSMMNTDNHATIRAERDLRDFNVGDSKTFWRYSFTVMPPTWEQADATCRAVGEHCYVFVSDEEWNVNMDQSEVDTILDYLENTTMNGDDFGAIQMDLEIFGEIPNELDNDEKIIVYYSALGSYNGTMFDGYFSAYNQLTEAEAATVNPPGHSNECEMIYMTCYPLAPAEPIRISVLSHELQHMIHWGQDANEDTWVDEGMAELAMVHFGMPDPINTFNGNANYSLNMWDQQWKDYVKVLLFFTYLDEQVNNSENFIADVVAEPLNGIAGIRAQLEELNYPLPFEEIFLNWTIANYLDEADIYDGNYHYDALELPNFYYNSFYNSFPDDETASVEPWATRYVLINNENLVIANLEVDQQVDVALLSLSTETGSNVEKYTISENVTIEIPALIAPYTSHVLVLANGNDSELGYTLEISEEVSVGENILGENNSFNLANYPNPFSLGKQGRATTISFNLDAAAGQQMEMGIYNSKGQKIRSFKQNEFIERNHVIWNGTDDNKQVVTSGVYFCKIKAGSKTEISKIMLMK